MKAGTIPEILPEEIVKIITQESKKDLKDYPFILMQFYAETSLPWIVKWDLVVHKSQFPGKTQKKVLCTMVGQIQYKKPSSTEESIKQQAKNLMWQS